MAADSPSNRPEIRVDPSPASENRNWRRAKARCSRCSRVSASRAWTRCRPNRPTVTGSCSRAQPARVDSATRSCSTLNPPGNSAIVVAITEAWSTDTCPAANAAAVAGIDRPPAEVTLAA